MSFQYLAGRKYPSDHSPGRSRYVLNSVAPTLFETRRLTDDAAVAAVIGNVEAAITSPAADLDDIALEAAENPSYALEFILSGKWRVDINFLSPISVCILTHNFSCQHTNVSLTLYYIHPEFPGNP